MAAASQAVEARLPQGGEHVAWAPQPGPQTLLLTCPVPDIFYGGARGGGKTDGALGHWSKHERLYGRLAQGVVFRRRYKQLSRMIDRAKQLFIPLGAKWYESKDKYWFVFPSGACLRFRHLDKKSDAEEYQGHDYTWICFEELPQWPTPDPVDMLYATMRSGGGVQPWFVATGNPGGVGHTWVKERYITPAPAGTPFLSDLDSGGKVWRVFIPAKVWDNRLLLAGDPTYVDRLKLSGPRWLVQAWLDGNWDINPGGFLDGIWDPSRHVVQPYPVPVHWRRWRAMDWGFAAPYSVGWYAMDPVHGRIIRYRELYGYGGNAKGTREDASAVAAKIRKFEEHEAKAGVQFRRSPADHDIFAERGQGGTHTIASIMSDLGVKWIPAVKGPRSRVNSAQIVVYLLNAGLLQVFDNCRHFLRTVPGIPADEDDPEDVDTEAEDHAWDELRYSVASRHKAIRWQADEDRGPSPFTMAWLMQGEERVVSRYKR